ncbi:sensor domain-containing diguanylate cyclase [Salirhabdus sp. Marseille-P4669]|uniref:sensor domain-containing diguanylate cyclase n=1 Tax=Salirhabdus sp. Marseille-P4669 TaxID=2042310 RepID=UPI000C7BA65C|nr:sensor domain-containing diguanylate cyclase [Salirhabdus sp. Marseille-P4669]
MTKRKQWIVWLVWLLIWPTIIIYLFNVLDPSTSIDGKWFDVISFALLMCIVAIFPIIVGETPIFFIHGISFAVFLHFGLFVEIILTELAVITLLIKLRLSKSQLYRIPVNLTLFLLTSIIGAAIFYLVGGENGELTSFSLENFVPIICYALGIIISNQVLLHLLQMFTTGTREKFFSSSLLWDLMTSIITLPVGFILYLLYSDLGAIAIYFVGIPFIMISGIITSFYTTNQINRYMQKTSNIGQKLTGHLNVKEVLDVFVTEISDLLKVDYTYIYDVTNSNEMLSLIRYVDASCETKISNILLTKNEGISGTVYGKEEGMFFTNRLSWYRKIKDQTIPQDAESLMSVPIRRNDKVVGIITIVSKRKRAYEKYHFMLLDILSNYLAVAIENARHYENTKKKSERDPLTKLYNFRYFEGYLQGLFEDMKAKGVYENHSLILLDLDHFKQVNDLYGHESGNEVLRELATRLNSLSNENTIVARYGGEEFVLLLKNRTKDEAIFEAERIRKMISDEPFFLQKHIMESENSIEIQITASIGLATFPDDCDESTELIRHADRAMYVGAKRKGRNRVATYEKAIEV